MSHSINILRIKVVNNALGVLKDKVVFVGGATISLYPDRQVFEVRATDDVDVIIEILNYSDRADLEEQLRTIGFEHDIESPVVCRYKIQGIIVDIMPTDDISIGFKNKWYPQGFKKAVNYLIDETNSVKILSAPYFIATKLEAYKGRGNDDGRTSPDFEDIIYVLENRNSIWQEMDQLEGEIKAYLKLEFSQLLNNQHIQEWIDSHVERGSPPRTYYIIEALKKFCS
ncbi:MAG: nucleotidyl transferase AbiEii/AbiGii toxin family protein [Ferruginibacter sp.]